MNVDARALSRPRTGDAGPDRRPRAIHLRLGLRPRSRRSRAATSRQSPSPARSARRRCRTSRPRKEQGLDFDVLTWQGLFLAKDTPAPIVSQLNAALSKALDLPSVRGPLRAARRRGRRRPSAARRSTSASSSRARSRAGAARSRPAASRWSDACYSPRRHEHGTGGISFDDVSKTLRRTPRRCSTACRSTCASGNSWPSSARRAPARPRCCA